VSNPSYQTDDRCALLPRARPAQRRLRLIRNILLAGLVAVIPVGGFVAPAQGAVTVPRPGRITAVTARPGPGPGQVTFSWNQDGSHTTAFIIETGLTSFKVGDPNLPDHGRAAKYFAVASGRRSITLSAAQVASAGASAGSANHLYYRLKAMNRTRSGTAYRDWPYLQSVAVAPTTPSRSGAALRVASFNVRTAHATDDARVWLQRAPLVAGTILSRNPGVVALQELSPGRADGKALPTTGSVRQTVSLVNALRAAGGSRYRLVRTTPYVKPGVPEGSQGARILYDTSRYSLVSPCPETARDGNYSSSCTIVMPLRASDSATIRRRAAYAVLADRATGKRFFVVSAHLDARHSTNATTEHSYETLRASQAKAVLDRVNQLDTAHLPVVLAGDLNTWQNNKAGYGAHDALVASGYYDTAAALTQVNVRYTTMNAFARTILASASGWGARLDVITVKGVTGAARFENVMKVTDTNRPSDHNMVVADIRLP